MVEWPNPLAFDFETSGKKPEYALQPWRVKTGNAWATSLVYLTGPQDVQGGLNPDRAMMKRMLEQAIDEKRRILGWNTVFDIQWLLAYGLEKEVFAAKWLDGMLLWRHFYIEPEYEMAAPKKFSYGLKNAVSKFLPKFAGYEDNIDFHDETPEVREKLHTYNRRDTIFTYRISETIWDALDESQQRCALLEAASLPMVARANLTGMKIDLLTAHELQGALDNVAAQKLSVLWPLGVTEETVRSPIKLAKFLYDEMKYPVLKENKSKKTGNVSRSTDKEVLHELAFKYPVAKTIKEFREALGNKTKFADTPIDAAVYNGDGHARPQGIVFGTYSGRLTYSSAQGTGKAKCQTGFALHQMKGIRSAFDTMYRGVVIAPEGYTIMEFDASGQEFRWMAIASGDTTMLTLCQPGEDAHSFMGARINEVDYRQLVADQKSKDAAIKALAKDMRQLGKVGNLCVAAGAIVLTDRGPCSIEDVALDDLVWDGEEFVAHEGVSFSGWRHVMSYDNVTATPSHEVMIGSEWQTLEVAAGHGWRIKPALGTRWTDQARSAVRIVVGIVSRTIREKRRSLRRCEMRLWGREGCEPTVFGDRPINEMQSLRGAGSTQARRASANYQPHGSGITEACQRVVSALQQPQRSFVSQLRRAWYQMLLWVGGRGGRVYQAPPAAPDVSRFGHRPTRQRWSLRSWKFALGYAQTEPSQSSMQPTFDIVNCGSRMRFTANGKVVHNSLQYRTSARKLRVVARVQYNIPMEMPQAQLIHATYQKAYPGVPKYWARQINLTKKQGYVETYAGRRVRVEGNWDGSFGWSMASTSINYRIQGTGADQKYLALAVLKDYLTEIGAYFAWDLHDGIYIYVPDSRVDEAAVHIKYLLDNLPYEKAWGFSPPIPLPFDCKYGGSWGTLVEYKYDD